MPEQWVRENRPDFSPYECWLACLLAILNERGRGAKKACADNNGFSREHLSNILHRKSKASRDVQDRIAFYYGLDLSTMLTRGEELLRQQKGAEDESGEMESKTKFIDQSMEVRKLISSAQSKLFTLTSEMDEVTKAMNELASKQSELRKAAVEIGQDLLQMYQLLA